VKGERLHLLGIRHHGPGSAASVLKGVREKLRQIDVPESLQARILSVLEKQR